MPGEEVLHPRPAAQGLGAPQRPRSVQPGRRPHVPLPPPSTTRLAASNFQGNLSTAGQTNMDFFVSKHPDALKRREQANLRKALAQMDAETASKVRWWEGPHTDNLVVAASPEQLRELLQTQRLVVCSFFAPWCAACRRLFPKLKQLAENNSDVVFVKVNGGDQALSAFVSSLGVDKLPYFHFYKRGWLCSHFAANLLRVDLLRAEIAAHKECNESSCIVQF